MATFLVSLSLSLFSLTPVLIKKIYRQKQIDEKFKLNIVKTASRCVRVVSQVFSSQAIVCESRLRVCFLNK